MKNQITIREAVTEQDIAVFWQQLRIYFIRDIFPNPEDEDREYFLSVPNTGRICKRYMIGRRIAAITCSSIGMAKT